jgi:hypothetical protein
VMRYREPTRMRSTNHRKRPTHKPRPLVEAPGGIWIVWGRLYRDMDALMLDHDGLEEQVINPSRDDPPLGVGAWKITCRYAALLVVYLCWSDDSKCPRPRALPQKVGPRAWDQSYDAINRMLGEESLRCSVWTVSGGLPTLGKRR